MSVNEIINTCSQGTASDLVVDAMSRLSETWQFDMTGMMDDRFQALMNIHDDLTFGLPEDSLEDDISIIAKAMCLVSKSFDFINVPITVEVSCGTDWSNQEEIGVYSSEDFK
jgi:DNA polymerase I-like protein with 3'-5' exonuclease and polymerase domains